MTGLGRLGDALSVPQHETAVPLLNQVGVVQAMPLLDSRDTVRMVDPSRRFAHFPRRSLEAFQAGCREFEPRLPLRFVRMGGPYARISGHVLTGNIGWLIQDLLNPFVWITLGSAWWLWRHCPSAAHPVR